MVLLLNYDPDDRNEAVFDVLGIDFFSFSGNLSEMTF